MKSLATAAFVLLAAMASAQARDVRFPESGSPAFTFQIPDAWFSQPSGSQSLIVGAPDRSVGMTFTLGPNQLPLDDVAAQAMQVAHASPPSRGDAVTISGFSGYTYFATATNSAGMGFHIMMRIVKLDEGRAAIWTFLAQDTDTPAQIDEGKTVFDSVQIEASGH